MEPLLVDQESRYTLFPIQHNDLFDMYQKHKSTFWTPEEVDLQYDVKDFEKLSENEKRFVKYVLAFFASSDLIVNENLVHNFCKEVKYVEAQFFYRFQMMIEDIHQETYSQLIDTYIKDKTEKHQLFNAIKSVPCVKEKATWAFKYMNPDTATFAERLIAFAIFEGIFFSGSFCAIFWLKKRGLMPGLTFSNELISRDEGIHCKFACLLYKDHLKNKLSDERVHEIMDEAIQQEIKFVKESLPVELIGMNSNMMIEYIKFCADRLLLDINHPKLYNAKNPFDWMEMISIDGKTNFFERRVGEYSKAGVGDKPEDNVFSLDEDF